MTWSGVTATSVYTVQSLQPLLEQELLPRLSAAAPHGLQWYYR